MSFRTEMAGFPARRQRMVVTGQKGQVVASLIERSQNSSRFEIIAVGRPELDLCRPETISAALWEVRPDVIISAAAYTAVDQAEAEEEVATVVNGISAGAIASAAAVLGVPIIHLSTDYVFDGTKGSAYLETDPVAPLGAYGRSKLVGEKAVAAAAINHVILRTAWVYSPFGKNFVKTMLQLAVTRDRLNVVEDQIGNPTSALDIAEAIFAVAGNLLDSGDPDLRGIFHLVGGGEANWADFANEIFAQSRARGGPSAIIDRIPSSAYPTPARRPANSRLDCRKLAEVHQVELPPWEQSTSSVISMLI